MTRALSLLALLLATPALALDAARCEWEMAGFSEYEHGHPVIDLGGGMVVQFIEREDAHAARDGVAVTDRTIFELCPTGRALQVDGDHAPVPGEPPGPVARIVQDAIASPEPVTLEDLVDRVRGTGAGAWVIEAPEKESCGCALFHPGLRPPRTPP